MSHQRLKLSSGLLLIPPYCEPPRRHVRSGPEGIKSSFTIEENTLHLPACSLYETHWQHFWGGVVGMPESAWQQSSTIARGAHNEGFLLFLKRRFSWSLSWFFWSHFSSSHVSGTREWKTCWGSTRLISDLCLVPLTHWPLNYLLSRLCCATTTGRQGRSLQYGWHVPCFPTARHM